MKKAIISSLILSLIPGFCLGVNDRIYKLMQEKQAKMEKLEKCQGTTKNLKIAGLSTLGITAVGVGANIAEAVVLNDYKSDVAKAKDARDAQQKIKDDRLAKLAKGQDADIIQNRETEKEVEPESVEAPKTTITNNDVSDVFDTEQACQESCKTSTGCFSLTSTNKWTCVSDLPNNVSIANYRPFVNVLDCMEYCAEDCEMVNTSLYRCYKSKAQAEKEKPVDKEDALVPVLLKDLEQKETAKQVGDNPDLVQENSDDQVPVNVYEVRNANGNTVASIEADNSVNVAGQNVGKLNDGSCRHSEQDVANVVKEVNSIRDIVKRGVAIANRNQAWTYGPCFEQYGYVVDFENVVITKKK